MRDHKVMITPSTTATRAREREGWAFAATAFTILALVASLFLTLYPDVMPALDPRFSLTVDNASSSRYTLVVMTWVALVMTPFVVAYQAWTYWVFRRRIGTQHIPGVPAPAPR